MFSVGEKWFSRIFINSEKTLLWRIIAELFDIVAMQNNSFNTGNSETKMQTMVYDSEEDEIEECDKNKVVQVHTHSTHHR